MSVLMSKFENTIVLTDPAGLLGPDDHVSAPEAGAVVAAAGDVEEAGQRRAREPDSSAVQETAQRGAQRSQHLVKVTLFTSFIVISTVIVSQCSLLTGCLQTDQPGHP